MSKPDKKQNISLKVLFVTPARSKIMPLQWQEGRVSMEGEGSCKIRRAHVFPKGAPFDAIWVQGQSEAVPYEKSEPLTSWEFDSAADTDLLNQVHGLARGPKASKASWVGVGMNAAVIVGLIVLGVWVNGGIDDLEVLIRQLFQSGGGGGDSTVYRPGV